MQNGWLLFAHDDKKAFLYETSFMHSALSTKGGLSIKGQTAFMAIY